MIISGIFEPAYNPLNQYSTARKAGAGRHWFLGAFCGSPWAAYPSDKYNCRGGDSVENLIVDDLNHWIVRQMVSQNGPV